MCRVPPAITGPRQGRLAATAAGLPRPRGLGLSWRDLELPPRLRWWGLCSSATTSHRAVHEFCPITGRDGWDDFFGTKQVGAEGGALLALQVTPESDAPGRPRHGENALLSAGSRGSRSRRANQPEMIIRARTRGGDAAAAQAKGAPVAPRP